MTTPAPSTQQHNPALPKQLRDQIAAAADLYKEGPVIEHDPNAPAPGTEVAAVVVPTPDAPLAAPADNQNETWEQKYNSLRGRLEQERKDNQALVTRLNNLDALVSTMKAAGAEAPVAPVAVQPARLLSEQEEADYGPEMLDVVGRRAKEVFSPELEQLASRLAKVEGRVEGVGNVIQRSAQEKLYDSLTNAVPTWRDINVSDGFKAWLGEIDKYSGAPRMDLLQNAFTRHEADRVIQFFQGYTEATSTPLGQQAQTPLAPPLAQPGNGSGKTSLLELAAPGRARSAPDPLSPEKPIYTSASIAQFYADERKGKYKGREADFNAIETDIFAAQHEGRIRA